jgi:hypothetical protein
MWESSILYAIGQPVGIGITVFQAIAPDWSKATTEVFVQT